MADEVAASSSAAEAAAYERNNVKLLFEPLAAVVVERSAVGPGDRVLDVACGTGIVARTAAPTVGPSGLVVGSDLNPAMLAEAATHVPADVNIEWREANAEQLVFEDASFDVLFCQQGLQFVPDRAAAASEMQRVLAPGGKAVVAIWRSLAHNMIPRTWHDCIAAHLSPETAAVLGRAFSDELDDPEMWGRLFTTAGFPDVDVESVELMIESDDPRGRMTGPLSGLPVGDQVMAMEPATTHRDLPSPCLNPPATAGDDPVHRPGPTSRRSWVTAWPRPSAVLSAGVLFLLLLVGVPRRSRLRPWHGWVRTGQRVRGVNGYPEGQ